MNRAERRRQQRLRKKARGAAPLNTQAAIEQGLKHHRAGQLDRAEALYAEVLKTQPGNAEALHLMGILLSQKGRHKRAASLIRKAIRARPDNAEAHDNLGNVLYRQGMANEAIACFERAIEIRPDYGEAHYHLGNLLKAEHQPDAAAASYRRALEANPDNASAYNNLGGALKDLDRPGEAIESYQRAIEINPDDEEPHYNLGTLFRERGRADDALASYRRALEINPNFAKTHANIATLLAETGALEEAIASYRRALEADPKDAETHRMLAQTKNHEDGDADLAAMKRLLESPETSRSQAMHLYFGLAKIYEELKEFDSAFGMLAKGNEIKRDSLSYDIRRDEATANEIMATCDKDFMNRRKGAGCPSQRPIFIVGMPRSATTLCEQILVSHSRARGGGELNYVDKVLFSDFDAPSGRRLADYLSSLKSADFARFGESYVGMLDDVDETADFVTDKNPLNFWYVGLIHLMLPNSKIIHCVRNPLDSCMSCFRNLFTGQLDFTYSLSDLGRYYQIYDRFMSHWRAVVPEAFMDVRYEDLAENQERETRRLLEYCGLEWEEACLTFHQTRRTVKTASMIQVRRPLFRSSVGRWKRFEKHLGPLREALGPLAAQDGRS